MQARHRQAGLNATSLNLRAGKVSDVRWEQHKRAQYQRRLKAIKPTIQLAPPKALESYKYNERRRLAGRPSEHEAQRAYQREKDNRSLFQRLEKVRNPRRRGGGGGGGGGAPQRRERAERTETSYQRSREANTRARRQLRDDSIQRENYRLQARLDRTRGSIRSEMRAHAGEWQLNRQQMRRTMKLTPLRDLRAVELEQMEQNDYSAADRSYDERGNEPERPVSDYTARSQEFAQRASGFR